MKLAELALVVALAVPFAAAAQGNMKGMDMKDMDMKGMDMKSSTPATGTHHVVGVVKKMDARAGTVTLTHEPVKSMNWPAMTMTFHVKDKSMLDKMAVDNKVNARFEQRGKEYVITAIDK